MPKPKLTDRENAAIQSLRAAIKALPRSWKIEVDAIFPEAGIHINRRLPSLSDRTGDWDGRYETVASIRTSRFGEL